jgi:hypothetical protein
VDDILHIGITIHDVVLHWYWCTIGGTPCWAKLCCHSLKWNGTSTLRVCEVTQAVLLPLGETPL